MIDNVDWTDSVSKYGNGNQVEIGEVGGPKGVHPLPPCSKMDIVGQPSVTLVGIFHLKVLISTDRFVWLMTFIICYTRVKDLKAPGIVFKK